MEIVKLILDFIASVAWPLALFAVLFIFRNQIKSLVEILTSMSTMRLKFGGQEFTLERKAKQILIENHIESALAGEPRIDKENIRDVAKKIASDVLSLDDMLLTESDIIILKIISERKEISSQEAKMQARKRGVFANLGTLTGLEHDELISGHFKGNPMTNKVMITEKGLRLLDLLSDKEAYRKYVYK